MKTVIPGEYTYAPELGCDYAPLLQAVAETLPWLCGRIDQ
jgi:hypothetical protein